MWRALTQSGLADCCPEQERQMGFSSSEAHQQVGMAKKDKNKRFAHLLTFQRLVIKVACRSNYHVAHFPFY